MGTLGVYIKSMRGSRGGEGVGAGGLDPPEKSQRYRIS